MSRKVTNGRKNENKHSNILLQISQYPEEPHRQGGGSFYTAYTSLQLSSQIDKIIDRQNKVEQVHLCPESLSQVACVFVFVSTLYDSLKLETYIFVQRASHRLHVSGKLNSRLNQMRSQRKQKYKLPDS